MDELDRARELLCALGEVIRSAVLDARRDQEPEMLAAVASSSAADTIYAIDRFSEAALAEWFETQWPADMPVELIHEGEDEPRVYPNPNAKPRFRCIVDPIDGTRGLMYDKRPAWALAGLSSAGGRSLSDLQVSVMTEIPTSRQWRSDQFSAIAGRGVQGSMTNILSGSTIPIAQSPSKARDFRHGFSSFAKFFPEGRALTAQIEESIWDALHGLGSSTSPVVFDDQYISTGGQFYELLMGHDRMIADIRPLVLAAAGLNASLCCHPYDMAAWVIAREAGIILEHPFGGFPDAPLDTTSSVCWVAYGNRALADLMRPVLRDALGSIPGRSTPPHAAS